MRSPSLSGRLLTKSVAILSCLTMAVAATAQVSMELLDNKHFQVKWKDQTVILKSRPQLRRLGGGMRKVFDPTARVFREVRMSASQSVFFKANNKLGEPIFLGNSKLTVERQGEKLVYRQQFENAGAWWQLVFQPIDDNGLDIKLEAHVAPEFNLIGFDINMFNLNLQKATADSGHLGHWRRKLKTTKDLLVGPLPGKIRLNYPSNNLFVPAAVMQDDKLAVGICRLGVHNVWRTQFGELIINPKRSKYEVRCSTGWAEAVSTECLYQNSFKQQYRLRFSEKRTPGKAGYLQLVDAKDLWKDYMAEMDKYVPAQSAPSYDKSKNNIMIMNFFMAENHCISEKNPQGWVLNDPNWKTNKWEFPAEAATATGDKLKQLTGFSEDNIGRPVKWIKAYAEKNVKEMKETNSLANVVWRSATWRGANNLSLDYLPDTHYFHPEMEERMTVTGPVRNWDWIIADIEVVTSDGTVIARKSDAAIHAADLGKLRRLARYEDNRQRLAFKADNLLKPAADYAKSAANIGAEERYRDMIKLYLKVDAPKAELLGKTVGDTVNLKATALVHNPKLDKKLTIKATIKAVERAAIDVWAKTLTDAGCEIGFLIREDFLMGPPWHQTFMRLDWTAEWQYNLFCQRVEWHQARFGKKCRWFYLDVFANETPDFVIQHMRRDYPDCLFFAEHPNGVAIRTIQTWNWFNSYTALELYLNPNALATVIPERILSGGYSGLRNIKDRQKDIDFMKRTWHSPNYIFVTHRGARSIIKLAHEFGLVKEDKKAND